MDNFNLQLGTADYPINDIHFTVKEDVIIRDNWTDLARGLGLSSQTINKLQHDMLLDKINNSDVLFKVLESWVAKEGSSATLGKFLNVVEVHCKATGVGEQLRLRFNLQCKSADDNPAIEWKEIPPAFQKRVKENLRQFFPNVDFVDEDFSTLQGALLINLMNGNKPRIFKDTIPTKLSYYINRTFTIRNIISTTIFENDFADIFVFTGMDRLELSTLSKRKMTSSSREQLKSGGDLTVHYMLLDQASHFDKICGRTTHPVHLLRKEDDGRLRWIRSVGGLGNLQSCISQAQEDLDEETFCNTMDSQGTPICISDTPGMGKSILLGQIGRRLMELYPSRTVLFIPLNEFITLVKQQTWSMDSPDKLQGINRAMQFMICENGIGEAVLKSMLNSQEENISIELLLDGFDEIDSADHSFAHVILQTIITSFKSTRTWVTCRPHLLTELENGLGSLGYNIRAFCEDDQVQFLSMYWVMGKELLVAEKIKEFAHHCLQYLKSKMNAKEQDIAGIPLQCLLIGEVYEDDATDYAGMDSDCPLSSLEIEIGTITSLYQQLIERKMKKYMSTYGERKLTKRELMEMHASLSIDLIFPDYAQKLELPKPVIVEILKVGLLESSGETSPARFIHRTFAEYFIAWFVANNLRGTVEMNSGRILLNFMFEQVFDLRSYTEVTQIKFKFERYRIYSHKFVHIVITHFLNELLIPLQQIFSSMAAQIHSHYLYNEHSLTKSVHACVNEDLIHIFTLFCKEPIFGDNFSYVVDGAEILLLAIRNAGVGMVKLAWDLCELQDKIDYDMKISAVNNAAAKANFSVLEYLMKDKELDEIVTAFENQDARDLVKSCVEHTLSIPESEILRRVQILRMFLLINPSLLDKVNWEGSTPVVLRSIHTAIRISLIRFRADVLGTNDRGKNILHRAAIDAESSTDYQKLLLSIPVEERRQLIVMRDEDGKTPLRVLQEYTDPSPDIFQIFMNLGEDFSRTDESSVLARAIEGSRNIDTIRYLMQFVASPNNMSKLGQTTLLHIAARVGNVAAVGILIDEMGMDVNAENEYGRTPLDEASRSDDLLGGESLKMSVCLSTYGARFRDRVQLQDVAENLYTCKEEVLQHVQHLVKLGEGAGGSDKDGNTNLHWALEEIWDHDYYQVIDCNNELIQLLLENGANPNAKNNKGETVFHKLLRVKNRLLDFTTFQVLKTNLEWSPELANVGLQGLVFRGTWESEFLTIFHDLEEHGAQLNCVDGLGNSLLHFAACSTDPDYPRHNLEALKFLVEVRGMHADLNRQNRFGETPLHVAAADGNFEIMKYLIDKGIDIFQKDKHLQTFLHVRSWLRSDELHELVQLLIGKGLSTIFDIPGGENGATPLQVGIQRGPYHFDEETLDLLHSNQVNFNATDRNGKSVLAYGSAWGQYDWFNHFTLLVNSCTVNAKGGAEMVK